MSKILMAIPLAWDLVEETRGTAAMLMFILEEALQAAMMAEYLAFKEKDYQLALELNDWIRESILADLKEFSTSTFAKAAYPLELSYQAFAQATEKSLDAYKKLIQAKLSGG